MLTQVHIARILWASQPSNWDTLSIHPLQHLEAHKPLCDCQLCLKICYYQVSHHSCTSYHGGFSWHKHFLNGKKSEIKLQTYSKYSFWEAEMLTGVIRSCGFSFLTLPEDKNNQEHFSCWSDKPRHASSLCIQTEWSTSVVCFYLLCFFCLLFCTHLTNKAVIWTSLEYLSYYALNSHMPPFMQSAQPACIEEWFKGSMQRPIGSFWKLPVRKKKVMVCQSVKYWSQGAVYRSVLAH